MSRPWRLTAWVLIGAAPWVTAAGGHAADDPYTATTAADPAIPIEKLELLVLPLSRAELEVEAAAWTAVLKANVHGISATEIAIDDANEEIKAAQEAAQEVTEDTEAATPAAAEAEQMARVGEDAKTHLLDQLVALREERAATIDRVNVVLAALEEKGGDVSEQRLYVAAVSGVLLDVGDTSATWATIVGWVTSPQGGIRLGLNILKCLAIFAIAWLIAVLLGKAVDRALQVNRRLSQLMRQFISTSVRRVALAIGVIVAISALGVNIGPLLAAIGAAGLVIGLALQGTLGNFASGILILFYRPFDVGDFVDVAGVAGTVDSLSLVSTTIKTPDNKVMVLPNNMVWGSVITNVTGSTQRRVDMVFGVAYEADIAATQAILERIVKEHPLVLAAPEPVIKVHELADSSVNFVCRPWTSTADYWTVYWDVTRAVKEELDKAGIAIPFPQRDVHVYHETKEPPLTEVVPRAGERVVSPSRG